MPTTPPKLASGANNPDTGISIDGVDQQSALSFKVRGLVPSLSRLHDAVIHGTLDDWLLQREITLAFGAHRADTVWINQTMKVGELLVSLSKFARAADKDGKAMLQGSVVPPRPGDTDKYGNPRRGVARTAKNMVDCDVLMIDDDTGESIAETVAKLRARNLLAVVWTTWSHGKAETAIAEDKVTSWQRKKGKSGLPTAQDLSAILKEQAGTRTDLLKDARVVGREHLEGGVKYLLRHEPVARKRILLLLAKRYVFAARPGLTHAQAMEDWSRAYAAVAEMIGLTYDRSCADPSRLMFLPRIPTNAVIGPGTLEHQIIILGNGELLDLDQVERVREGRAVGADGPKVWRVQGLGTFWKKYATRFRAADYVESNWADTERRNKDLAEVVAPCPPPNAHSKETDPLCLNVCNGNGERMAILKCRHDSCQRGRSPADYLDAVASACGHTVEDLEQYVDQTEEEIVAKARRKETREDLETRLVQARTAAAEWEQLKTSGDNEQALKGLVSAVGSRSNRASQQTAIDRALKAQATQDELGDKSFLTHLDILAGVGVGVLKPRLKAMREAYLHAMALPRELERTIASLMIAPSAETTSDSDVPWLEPPTRGQEGTVPLVRGEWDHQVQVRVAKSVLERCNDRAPFIYRNAEGNVVRVEDRPNGTSIVALRADEWADVIGANVEYRKITQSEGDKGRPLPDAVIREIRGAASLRLPTIEHVLRTPMFGLDGTLHTARGYVPELHAFLDPPCVFKDVAKAPTDEDVRQALALLKEPIEDFPFSDAFDGTEALPYKIGRPDANGYRETNLERGYCSRWNTWAAMLHPQVRHLLGDDSTAPGFQIDKSVAGEGAGYLMNTINIINTGRALPIRVYVEEDHFYKEITAALRSGDPIIGIDNIIGTIESGPFAAALTGSQWVARVFGTNTQEVRIPTRAMWVLAGNNFTLSGELMQRMVPVRLDSGLPEPAVERAACPATYFRCHPRLLEDVVRDRRIHYVWGLHTLIARWFAEGRPKGTTTHPRFPAYSAVVGGILELAANICRVNCGFLGNLGAYRKRRAPDDDVALQWMQLCFAKHGYQDVTAKDMVATAKDGFGSWIVNLPISSPHENYQARQASQFIGATIERRVFELDLSHWDAKARGRVRLVQVQEKNPVKYRFVAVTER